MKKRLPIIITAILFFVFLALGLAMAALYVAVESGHLQGYIERRVEQDAGLRLKIESLHLRWPLGVQAEGVSLALPEKEGEPLVVAERLKVKASLRALIRRQLVLVELISPRVSLNEQDIQTLKEKLPFGREDSGGFSAGLIKVTNGDVSLFISPVQAHLQGVNATLGSAVLLDAKQVLVARVRDAQFKITREEQNPYEIFLKDFKSNFKLAPSKGATQLEGDVYALVTADVPFFEFPPEVPIGLSVAADYLPEQSSLQNASFKFDIPLFDTVRAYGSIENLDDDPAPDLNFIAELPDIGRVIEYIEALKRPEYEALKIKGRLVLQGDVKGTAREPRVTMKTKAEIENVEWDKVSAQGLTAEIPAFITRGAISAGPGRIDLKSGGIPFGKKILVVSDVGADIYADTSSVHLTNIQGAAGPFGKTQGGIAYDFTTGNLSGDLSMNAVSSGNVIDFLRSAIGAPPKGFSMKGPFSLECRFGGVYDAALTELKMDFKYLMEKGELAPTPSVRIPGLDADLQGSLSSEEIGREWKFDIGGDLKNFMVANPSFQKTFSGTLPISFSGTYNLEKRALEGASAAVDLGPGGKVAASGSVHLDSGLFDVTLEGNDIDVQKTAAFVSPEFYTIPENISLAGTANLTGEVKGAYLPSIRNLEGSVTLDFEKGEFTSGEFVTAAGLRGKAQGTFASESPGDSWTFNTDGSVGGFELLIQTYYNSFQDSTFPFSASGIYLVKEKALKAGVAKVGLADMGEITANGAMTTAPTPVIDVKLSSGGIDLSRFYDQVGRQVLATVSPVFKDAKLSGEASGEVTIHQDNTSWETIGRVKVESSKFVLGNDSFAIGSLTAQLPFSLHSARKDDQAASVADDNFGVIRLKDVVMGPAHIAALDLNLAVQDNALYIKEPAQVEVLGGKFSLGEIRADDILSPSVKVTTSFSAEEVELTRLLQEMGLPKIPATANALFPSVVISRDMITTDGTAGIYAFDGAIIANSVRIEQPFSPVRTFAADLDFEQIDLAQFTDVMQFGTMTGVMNGTVKGLEISQGQPAAFVADFETIPARGVRQTISFDAVENISILGTGRGFQATISRGLFSFIDVFRYDKIGFQTTLKNDNFRIRGKVVKDGTEYFVKGVFFGPSINVINRNPGQTVGFKSMLERISRINRSSTSGE